MYVYHELIYRLNGCHAANDTTMPIPFQLGNRNLHRAIIEQAQEAVIFADCSGTIQLWNRGAEIIFGYSTVEAVGKNLNLIIPEKLRHAHDEGFRHAVCTGATRNNGRVVTTRAQNKFGSRLYVDLSFELLKDESGAVIGAFAIGRDATARHLEQIARRLVETQPG
jgi:PAS domain S-box-containing protein